MLNLLWKHMNLHPEATPWGRQMQERLALALEEIDRLHEHLGTTSRIGAVSANEALGAAQAGRGTQAELDELEKRVDELSKAVLPAGGGPGTVLRRNRDEALKWFPNHAGMRPLVYVMLEEGSPSYEWHNPPESDINPNMPEVEFENNGVGFRAVAWPWESFYGGSDVVASYEVDVTPHFDGQEFFISVRSDGWAYRGLGRYDIVIVNHSNEFGARVHVGSNDVSNDFKFQYADSSVVPWQRFPNPVSNPGYYYHDVDLVPNEMVGWIVEGSTTTWTNQITPAIANTEDSDGKTIIWPTDSYYFRHVQSLKHQKEFTATGELSTRSGKALKNVSNDSRRIGLIHASVDFPSSGADILIDVKLNGLTIFTSPLAIAAGTTEASKEPNAYTHGPGGTKSLVGQYVIPSSVIWRPGDELSVDILQVGTTEKGADLTVQVYYG
jgi:hypothetical protein